MDRSQTHTIQTAPNRFLVALRAATAVAGASRSNRREITDLMKAIASLAKRDCKRNARNPIQPQGMPNLLARKIFDYTTFLKCGLYISPFEHGQWTEYQRNFLNALNLAVVV